MNPLKQKQKKQRCKEHREFVYLQAINKLCEGKTSPNYVSYRWLKLKDIR